MSGGRSNQSCPERQWRWREYSRQSARPLVSLVFVLPLMLVYELGTVGLGREAVRNGADVIMRQLLDVLGFGQYFVLPLATCAILLGWHHLSREPWRFSPWVLPPMLVESIVWAVLLLVLCSVQGTVSAHLAAAVADADSVTPRLARLVAFCGAGLYEELLFRLILLSIVLAVMRWAGGTPKVTLLVAVLVTSLVFSAAHYRPLTPHGETLAWDSLGTFVFRLLAGILFALLFLRRGFGIAAGSHALYDIISQELFNLL